MAVSTATPLKPPPFTFPTRFAQTSEPVELNLETYPLVSDVANDVKVSVDVSAGLKNPVPVKFPTVTTFPDPSSAIPVGASPPVPPRCLAQSSAPDGSNLATYESVPPYEVRFVVPGPGSKSTVPENEPVM